MGEQGQQSIPSHLGYDVLVGVSSSVSLAHHLFDRRKKDSKALLVIQQAVHESIFPRIAATNKSKDAWKILKDEYQGTDKRINRSAEKVIDQAFQSKLEVSPEKLKSQGSGVE
ncbi:hypothetical protein MRB53_026662 [Persea americana]|uniref:Uncharacterized protein n=1 Tax=Persea americana TaxID=3435 RepID=A0ACC2LIP9_PERAE|nr:hypothetical protein MRB53_026662 [Persea americana]